MRTTARAVTLCAMAVFVAGCASGKQVSTSLLVEVDGAVAPPQGDATPFSAEGDGSMVKPKASGPVPKVVITEFLANPAAVLDSTGEWFEVHNLGTQVVDLQGWVLKDDSSNLHTINGPVPLAPGGYLVLGKTKDQAKNGGAPVHYAYGSSWYLNNGADAINLFDPAMRLVDRVRYDVSAGWKVPPGASLSRKDPAGPAGPAGWCVEAKGWGGSKGDRGSPGGAAQCGN